MRRFEFSGRVQISCTVAHTKSEKHIRREIKNREKQGIFAKNGHFDQNSHNQH